MEFNQIKLECPKCKASFMARRCIYDPPEAAMMTITCPKCRVTGENESPEYFTKSGARLKFQLTYD